MNTKMMNGHEKIAAKNIEGAFNWGVGGWYNCFLDGLDEDIPSLEEAKETVYIEAMNNLYKSDNEIYGRAPKEMRFAGEEFCRELVEELFLNDGVVEEIWGEDGTTESDTKEEEMKESTREEARAQVVKNYTVKEMRETLKAAGIKGISRAKKDELVEMMIDLGDELTSGSKTVSISKVKMYAFTGMFIGEFEAELKDGKILVNTSSRGELMFDLNTGKEVCDERKARWANRVEAV